MKNKKLFASLFALSLSLPAVAGTTFAKVAKCRDEKNQTTYGAFFDPTYAQGKGQARILISFGAAPMKAIVDGTWSLDPHGFKITGDMDGEPFFIDMAKGELSSNRPGEVFKLNCEKP